MRRRYDRAVGAPGGRSSSRANGTTSAGFLGKAFERKARFYIPVEMTTFACKANGGGDRNEGGPTINAKQVVLATGYELLDIVPSGTHSIISTFALNETAKKPAMAGCGLHLGGFRSLPLYARNRRWAGDLWRGGRGFRRRGDPGRVA